jgi:hypothetical protein
MHLNRKIANRHQIPNGYIFGFIAFTIHHVYSAVLVSAEERNGLIESIFTGYKFVPAWDLEAQGFCAPEDLPKPPPATTTPTIHEPGTP